MRVSVIACCASAVLVAGVRGADPELQPIAIDCRALHPGWSPRPQSPYCPPISPPIDPTRPPPKSPTDPVEPPPPGDLLARAPEAGTQPATTYNPNMFGDLFGSRPSPINLQSQRLFQAMLTDAAGRPIVFGSTIGGRTLVGPAGNPVVLSDNGRASGAFVTNFTTTAPVLAASGNLSLLENTQITQSLQALNPNSTVTFVPDQSLGLRQSRAVGPGPIARYLVQQSYQISSVMDAMVMLPTGGGVAGRTKIADDNYPLPADRLIFNYDQFANTPLTADGYDVYRFNVGGEVTAFNGMASAELRFPFASTLDPVQSTSGVANRDTVFGDVNLTLKAVMLYTGDAVVAGGVGFDFPTAPDTLLRDLNGTDLLRIRNQALLVTPYVCVAASPMDALFVQGWVHLTFDTTGCEVLVAPMGAGLESVGRIHEAPLLQTDIQVGYWVLQGGGLGLAPFVELHYNQPIGTGDVVAANGFVLGDGGTFSEFNLTLGATALVGSNLMLSAGVAVPLREGRDRFFDYQIGIRANWFFGPGFRGPAMGPGFPG